MIVITTLTQHSDIWGGIKVGMEAGKGTSPSMTAAPASAHLSCFLHENGDLESGFKNLTCKTYPVSWCAVENDHQ